MNLGIVIQARLKSTRLPAKVMMDIAGKPLLGHVINNAQEVMDTVIVATPDKSLADYAIKQGVLSFIGSEDDVLDRYYQAASHYRLDHVIRITADNPMISPEMVRKLVKFYFEGDYDWAANCRLKITYPVGNDAEIFSFQALEKAWRETTELREYVTVYIYTHPELFKLGIMENTVDQSHLSWTVDTMEDLVNIRNMFNEYTIPNEV